MTTEIGQQLECAREALGLTPGVLAGQVGMTCENLLAIEAGDQTDPVMIQTLRTYFARRGITFTDPRFDPARSKTVIDEVVDLGDHLEDRPGPHSDPAY